MTPIQREMLLPIGQPPPDPFAAKIWPAFRAWPNLPASASEKRAREAWEQNRNRLPDIDALVACVEAHGAQLRRENERRGGKLGFAPVVLPHNWLARDEGWRAYLDQAAMPTAQRPCRLAHDAHARLTRAGLGEAEIAAWFDGAEFAVAGEALMIAVDKPFRRNWISANFAQRICAAWADLGVKSVNVRLKAVAA